MNNQEGLYGYGIKFPIAALLGTPRHLVPLATFASMSDVSTGLIYYLIEEVHIEQEKHNTLLVIDAYAIIIYFNATPRFS